MKQQNVETPEIEALGAAAMTKTELFFEENGKKITIAIIALFVVAAALFGYKSLVMDPTEDRAAETMYPAQVLFESPMPDYRVALEGDAATVGFLDVIKNYGSTTSGNLANHYAGICYLKLGDFDNALKYLKAYKAGKGAPAEIVQAQNIALQGDVAVETGNYSSAVELFKQAANVSENPLTSPMYLRKAGMAAQVAGDVAGAVTLYESVISLYPTSVEAKTAEKHLGTIKK